MQKRVWRLMKIQWKRLLMLRGDPRRIARGIALGVAINFIPTVGFGPPLVYWLAGLLQGHRTAALVSTMGIKVAIPLLYFLNYIVGEFLLEQRLNSRLIWHGVLDTGASFFLGMVINFTVTFVITYYWVLRWIALRNKPYVRQQ